MYEKGNISIKPIRRDYKLFINEYENRREKFDGSNTDGGCI